jgi:hypothetical protein
MAKYEYRDTPFCTANGTCSCFDDKYTIDEFMREPEGGFLTICHFVAFYVSHAAQLKDLLVVRCRVRA